MFYLKDGVFRSDIIDCKNVAHGFSTRMGGFSALPCGLATLSEGILAGLVAWRFPERRQKCAARCPTR